ARRMLGWITNRLNAAYFAVREKVDADALVYAVRFTFRAGTDGLEPMGFSGVGVYWPAGVAPRIIRQGGVFTIQGEPTVPIKTGMHGLKYLKIIIMTR